MGPWRAKAVISEVSARLLVQDGDGNDVLKACLPPYPKHPRALLSLLEAIAEWEGSRITCVISAVPDCPHFRDPERWDADLCTSGSASVSVEYAVLRGGVRLTGLGDFRDVRTLESWGAA